MSKKIVIDPVTRIEGHSKITLMLDDSGHVEDALFHVSQFRGFETLCTGRPFYEMPVLTARTCGICPVSHLVAAAKACDDLLAVRIPPAADRLRRIMNLSQIIQSHALSFFHLSSPDFLLGMDADPKTRNIFGLAVSHPEMAKDGIALRRIGQEIIALLGGKRIHPTWIVPGGVREPLSEEHRDEILGKIPEGIRIAHRTLEWFKESMNSFREEIMSFANFPTMFMGLVDEEGELNHYAGKLRVTDAAGKIVEEFDPGRYREFIGEAGEAHSYLKSPYWKSMGYPDGIYRVGPLARLNVVDRCGTPGADQELAEFKELQRGSILSSFYYHYARLIEILFCLERMEKILNHPDILSDRVLARAQPNNRVGIGVSEAPRGTLIHEYEIDSQGLITRANLVIATGHNNLAMNRGVLQVARHFVKDGDPREGVLNRIEAVIRAFDPCLSCSTHADGRRALEVEIREKDGSLRHRLQN